MFLLLNREVLQTQKINSVHQLRTYSGFLSALKTIDTNLYQNQIIRK